jgi:hypothetical protein
MIVAGSTGWNERDVIRVTGDVPDTGYTGQSADPISPAELRALVARLTRLEDERAIIDTLHRYGQAADDGEDEIWANLFVEDGVFLCLDRAGGEILREEGRPALALWLRNFRASEVRITKHCVLAPVVVRLEGGEATVKSYLTRISENPDPYAPPFLLLMGKYHDEMRKGADGKWRFRQRIAQTESPLREMSPRPAAN